MNFVELLQEFDIPFKHGGEHHHITHDWVGL